MPALLDCGTDNEEHLCDRFYTGLRQRRVKGERFDEFVDNFMRAIKETFVRARLLFPSLKHIKAQ